MGFYLNLLSLSNYNSLYNYIMLCSGDAAVSPAGLGLITQNHFNYNYFEISTSITITPQ